MDPKAEITKLWKDVQESAREFAHYSLQNATKALDFTAQRIRSWEETLKAKAEKLAPEKAPEATKTDETSHS